MRKRQGGKLLMEKILEILRLSEQGYSINKISHSCHVSRQTVRSYLRITEEKKLSSVALSNLSKEAILELYKKQESGRRSKSVAIDYEELSRELSKKGVTLYVLWEEHKSSYADKGLSYSAFCHRYRRYKKQKGLSLRQTYKGGEKLLVDYSGLKQKIKPQRGLPYNASIFVGVLGASNLIYTEATATEKMEDWISSHINMFSYIGGVPEILVPDNLKTGVTNPCRYEPGINKTYQELAEHYGIAVIPTRSYKPRDKAKAESAVKIVQNRILSKLRNNEFESISKLNASIIPLLEELNNSKMQVYGCSRWELFEESERRYLKPLPKTNYILSRWKKSKVNIDYHVEVEGKYYSVPYEYIHREVEVKIQSKSIEIYDGNKSIASHIKLKDSIGKSTIKDHMPLEHKYMLELNPSKLLEWAEQVGPHTKSQISKLLLSKKHIQKNYKSCCGLQSLSKKYGTKQLELACKKANELSVCSYKSIKLMLSKGNLKEEDSEYTVCRDSHSNIRGSSYYH